MKSQFIVGRDRFDLREIEAPTPGPGDVAIAVRRVGLCGSDRHFFKDDSPYDFASEPLIPGHEASGEVVAVGEGVDSLEVGDRVAIEPARPCRRCETCLSGFGNACPDVAFMGLPPTDGAMRETLVWPAELVEADRSGQLSFDDLMMLEPMAIAINAIDVVGFRAGWTAAVVGCGSVGLSLIAALKLAGAARVFATDTLDYKGDWARRYGADDFHDPANVDAAGAIERATGGRGVDVAFECAGELTAQSQAAALVRPVGRLALIGINPEERIALDAARVRRRALSIHYIRRSNETLGRAMRLATRFDPPLGELVTHRYGLDEAPKAFADFRQYADGVVKACVTME